MSGESKHKSKLAAFPPQDDQSIVIEDLYCEQLKVGHLMLSGRADSTASAGAGGRVVVQGIKSESDTGERSSPIKLSADSLPDKTIS